MYYPPSIDKLNSAQHKRYGHTAKIERQKRALARLEYMLTPEWRKENMFSRNNLGRAMYERDILKKKLGVL